MRLLLFIQLLMLSAVVCGADETPAAQRWPLWDGVETVEQYAQRVKLPSTKSLDLGGGVKLELVLIPAGKFSMGTPEPEKPIVGQTMVGISGGVLFVLLLKEYFQRYSKLTRSEVAHMLDISLDTATRDLKALQAEGYIQKIKPTAAPTSHYFVITSNSNSST